MSPLSAMLAPLAEALPTLLGRLIATPFGSRIVSFPPVAWAVRVAVRARARTLLANPPIFVAPEPAPRTTLPAKLEGIVQDLVETLGYFGAMVATYDRGDILSIKAIYLDPRVISADQLRQWEAQVSRLTPRPVSLTDPQVAHVDIYDPRYSENLSSIAANALRPQVRNDLYCLFTPIVPEAARPILAEIQLLLGIRQVIAVPFFQDAVAEDGSVVQELVGNLFAIKRDLITAGDVAVLSAIGRQAAAALQNERLNLQVRLVQDLVVDIQKNLESEEQILRLIARGVAEKLDYVGGMVAPAEADGSLAARSFALDPEASSAAIRAWESLTAWLAEGQGGAGAAEDTTPLLSAAAARSGRPITSASLASLLPPGLYVEQAEVEAVQRALRVRHLVAVPFFMGVPEGEERAPELVGVLVALSRSRGFSIGEIQLLQAFAQQAAAGIHNAQLYRRAEARRRASEIFGKMAFSASAALHALRNHVGAARTSMQIMAMFEQLDDGLRREVLAQLPATLDRLRRATELLDNLDQPARLERESVTDINVCLCNAIQRILGNRTDAAQIDLASDLPPIRTAPDMLTEAFKVLIKNAVEAVESRAAQQGTNGTSPRASGSLAISSALRDPATVVVTIRDSGQGIRREHLRRIFELGWTTKTGVGYGFGLFWTIDYIEGLGGRIEVESTWGEGTTFRVVLPAGDPAPQGTPDHVPASQAQHHAGATD